MARRVTMEDIRHINEVYYKCKKYTETAKETGWSVATVRNYVDKNYVPELESEMIRFNPDKDFPKTFSTQAFKGIDNYGELCILTVEEEEEMEQLRKEIRL